MLRLKLTVILLVLTVVAVMVALWAVGSLQDDSLEGLRDRLGGSHVTYGEVKKLRDVQMRDIAEAIAQSEVAANLSVLVDNRKQMHDLQARAYAEHKNDKDQWAPFFRAQTGFLNQFGESLADRVETVRGGGAWDEAKREAFVKAAKERLVACQSVAVNQCFFSLPYEALKGVVSQIRESKIYGLDPDIAVVTDDRLVGIADADKPTWSNDTRFGERYPILRQVKKGIIVRDVLYLEDYKGTFFVTAAPMFDASRQFLGAVLVGVAIDENLLKHEKAATGFDVTYIDGKETIKSTLEPRHLGDLVANVPAVADPPQTSTFQTDNLTAQFVPIAGNYSNKDVQVVMSATNALARSADGMSTWLPLLFGGMFVLAVLAMALSWMRFEHGFESLDSGIHEIVNGNRDYEFGYEHGEEMWNSLSQSLNLMVGVLQGRQIVTEDEFDEWAERVLHGDDEDDEEEAAAAVPAKAAKEPADAYYKRIYEEFARLRRKHGEPEITYVKFVDKVARQERMLAEQLGVGQVRLRVEDSATGPVFRPVKIEGEA